MCGITGFIDLKDRAPETNQAALKSMASSISHRGPDDEGIWISQENSVYLGHRRLSILDLSSAGHQPMSSACGRYVIVFNGEIYNHETLKKDLDQNNVKLKGHSDTEILVEFVSRHGISKTLEKIQGMFAIALWDMKDKTLSLIRDHIGKKPLYFGLYDGRIVFTSELKALHAIKDAPPNLNRAAFNQFVQYGYVAAPHSIYEHIYKLKPGHVITLPAGKEFIFPKTADDAAKMMTPFWDIKNIADRAEPREYHIDALREKLSSSVQRRMISDVPLGAFLSGGLDSALIVSLMQEQSNTPVKTYTIGFDETEFDETPYAGAIAKHLGTDHTSHVVTDTEARAIIPDLADIYDEPFADISQIPTYHVCKMARQHTTVALSGDGGDELFCGYSRYFMGQKLFENSRKIPGFLRHGISGILKNTPEPWLDHIGKLYAGDHSMSGKRLQSIARFMNADSVQDMVQAIHSGTQNASHFTGYDAVSSDIYAQNFGNKDPLDQMMLIDMMMYLPDDILVKVDRASMANSLEVRSPLLDVELIEWSFQIAAQEKIFPGAMCGKKPLYDLLGTYLPKDLIDRPKQGFSVPIAQWLRGPLNDWANDLLSEDALKATNLYDAKAVRKAWRDFETKRTSNANLVWTFLMGQLWSMRWQK